MSSAEEQIGAGLGDWAAIILSTIMPKGRHAAQGLIFLLAIGAAMAALLWWHTTRFEWWNELALYWWFFANSQTWALVASIAVVVGCVLGAWIDFVHLDARGAWPFFYLFTGICWCTILVWLWVAWPEEDTTGFHFTFAFLLCAVTGNFYATLTVFLKRAMMGGGGLRAVAAQQAHGKARAATEREAAAAVGAAPPKPKRRQFDN